MNTRVNEEKVAKIFNAFIEASTDDPQRLTALLNVLRQEGAATGLGYVMSDAIWKVGEKLFLLEEKVNNSL